MQGNCCRWTACLGRVILGLFFIVMAALNFMHPEARLAAMAVYHLPSADTIFRVWLVVQVILGLMLVIGRGVRTASWILIVLTVVAMVVFADFWHQTEPMKTLMQFFFMHDVAVIAALLFAASHKKHCE